MTQDRLTAESYLARCSALSLELRDAASTEDRLEALLTVARWNVGEVRSWARSSAAVAQAIPHLEGSLLWLSTTQEALLAELLALSYEVEKALEAAR